jgi:hypothetical protein
MSDQAENPEAIEQPMPSPSAAAWAPPESDTEFVFEDMASAPEWVDRGWASWDAGAPALAVPLRLDGIPPYTTVFVHPGDTLKFHAKTATKPSRFEVIAKEEAPPPETAPGEPGQLPT